MKIRTLTVSFGHPDPHDALNASPLFRVERVTDSVEFVPGQMLSKKEVDVLCASQAWKVTTIPMGGAR